jgi:hypothetical protein
VVAADARVPTGSGDDDGSEDDNEVVGKAARNRLAAAAATRADVADERAANVAAMTAARDDGAIRPLDPTDAAIIADVVAIVEVGLEADVDVDVDGVDVGDGVRLSVTIFGVDDVGDGNAFGDVVGAPLVDFVSPMAVAVAVAVTMVRTGTNTDTFGDSSISLAIAMISNKLSLLIPTFEVDDEVGVVVNDNDAVLIDDDEVDEPQPLTRRLVVDDDIVVAAAGVNRRRLTRGAIG